MENPVCKPITETNRAVPSVENVFSVLCAVVIISLLSFGISLFIKNPTRMAANRIPAIPTEMFFIRILPMTSPAIIIKNRRFIGESSIVRYCIVHHQIVAYARDGYRDTSSEPYLSVYQCDSDHRTKPGSQASFPTLQAIFLSNGQYPA